VQLFIAANSTLAQIRVTRELALMIEYAPNLTPENYSAETKRLSEAFVDKDFYLSAVVLWLRAKWVALIDLYGHQLVITERIRSFADRRLQVLVWELHTGAYLRRAMTADRKLIETSPDMTPDAETAIAGFADSVTPVAAKSRE
jgi:hypothetical protein